MGNRAILGTYNEAWGPCYLHKGVQELLFCAEEALIDFATQKMGGS